MVWEKAAEIIDLNASRQKLAAGETAGVFLANTRRAAGLSHANVADATKIKPRHLEAIETSDASALPALPYAVGFVKVYAGFLGLDAEAIAAQFKTDIAPPEDQAAPVKLPQAVDEDAGVRLVSIAAIGVIIAFVLWITFQVADGTGRDSAIEAAAGGKLRVMGQVTAPTPRPQLAKEQINPPIAVEPASPREPSIKKAPLPVAADSGAQTEAPRTDDPAPVASEGADNVIADLPIADLPILELPFPVDLSGPDPVVDEILFDISPLEEVPNARDVGAVDVAALPVVLDEIQSALNAEVPAAPSVRIPVIIEPKLIRSKAPHYPNRCERQASERETVTVFFDVTPGGRTTNARAGVSSNACFNEAALRAISKWRFEPETANGVVRLSTNRRATLNFQR
jgi:TonB family protein